MNYLVWLLRLLVFVLVLLFALNNTAPVSVTFYSNVILNEVPLIVVMLATFILGAAFAWLLALAPLLRRRSELARLRRKLEEMEQTLRASERKIDQSLEQATEQSNPPSNAQAVPAAAAPTPL